jgi:amino acid transporter
MSGHQSSGAAQGAKAAGGASGQAKPDRSMNVWSVAAMGVGAMVGAGIFALLGVVGLVAGRETYISFLLGGIVAILSGYTYAKLAARYPDAGGLTAYFHHAFGTSKLSGTLSLTYLITIAVTIALVAKAFGAYAAPLAFGNSNPFWVNAFASAIVIVLLLLNIADSSLVGKAEVVLVGIKLVILALLMAAGAYGMMGHPQVRHLTPHVFSLVSSVGLTYLAYAGFGMMTNAAGRVSNPQKTIPRAIYLAITIVILLYVGLSVIVLGSVSSADLKLHAATAVALAAKPVLGRTGYVIVSVAALLATASGVNAWIFTAMQISRAMVKVGNLPHMFAHFVWRKGTMGLLVGVAGILLAVNLLELDALARIASATFLFSYLAVQVAHWRLLGETKASRFLVGLGSLFIAGVLICFLWSTFLLQPWELALIVAFVIVSWFAEWYLGRSKLSRVA